MTIVGVASFDNLALGALTAPDDLTWLFTDSNSPAVYGDVVSGGRHGQGIGNKTTTASGGYGLKLKRQLSAYADGTGYVMGFSVKLANLSAAAFIAQLHGTSLVSSSGVCVKVYTDGSIGFADSVGTAFGSTATSGPGVIHAGVNHYVEVKAVRSGSSVEGTIRVDGIIVATTSTSFFGNSWTSMGIVTDKTSGTNTIVWDDFYLVSTAAAPYQDFLGDTTIEDLALTGTGTYAAWVGSDGDSTNNYALVDEAPTDTSDYVQSSVTDDKDSYALANHAYSGNTIKAVQWLAYVAWAYSAKNVAPLIRHGSDEAVGSTITLANAYAWKQVMWSTNAAGAAWGISDIDALEVGQQTKA